MISNYFFCLAGGHEASQSCGKITDYRLEKIIGGMMGVHFLSFRRQEKSNRLILQMSTGVDMTEQE